MSLAANIDTSEFQKLVHNLSELSGRELYEVSNDNMADWMLTASTFVPKADKASIRAMQDKEWWPALVTKIIHGGGYVLKYQKRIKKNEQAQRKWVDKINGRTMYGQKTESEFRKIDKVQKKSLRGLFSGRFKGVRDPAAAKVSASIIRRRSARVGAMKAYLGLAAKRFGGSKVEKFGTYLYAKHLKGVQVREAIASDVSIAEATFTFQNNFQPWVNSSSAPRGRPSPSEDVNWKRNTLMSGILAARPQILDRMRHAVNTKMDRLIKRAGGNG